MSNTQEQEIKKEKTKYYKKLPFWIPWIMLFMLLGICLYLNLWVKKNTKEYSPEDKFVRYSMGSKFNYDADLVLKVEDGITYLDKDCTVESDGSPLIYEGQNKYLLPVSMAYLNPNSEEGAKRVNYFATISCNKDNKKITVSYNDKEIKLKGGFFYDGEGTYIFAEEVDIVIDTLRYTLSPMSYVRMFYKDSIEIYDFKSGEYTYIELNDSNKVIAEAKTDYSINIGTNVMTIDNKPRIIFSDIEAMGVLE